MFWTQYDSNNRQTRVRKNTATAIDHFITNTVVGTEFKSRFFQTDLSDHFPIIFFLKAIENKTEKHSEHFVYKRYYDEISINLFKQKLDKATLYNIKNTKEPNEAYRKFLENISCTYKSFLSKKRGKVKFENLMYPWVTKAIAESSKKKQKTCPPK